jgi:hypothetical protein
MPSDLTIEIIFEENSSFTVDQSLNTFDISLSSTEPTFGLVTSHNHLVSDVTGLQAALDSAVTLTGTQTITNKTVELPLLTSLSVPDANLTNTSLFPSATSAGGMPVFSPVPKFLWHNLLTFSRWWGLPTYETYNGTTWTGATLDTTLFDGKEANGVNLVDGVTATGVRWTWGPNSNINHSHVRWWVIGLSFVGTPAPINTYLLESSPDGVTWTTRHTSTLTGQQAPLWLSVTWSQTVSAHSRWRLTITNTNAKAIGLSTIKAITSRWGNQGGGVELEYPYDWDAARRITIANGGAAARSDGALNIGATTATTAADGIFFGSDVNLYRSDVNTLRTDDALIVAGTIQSNGNPVVTSVAVPATATSTGTAGRIAYDSTHVYICIATNTWRRAALSTW